MSRSLHPRSTGRAGMWVVIALAVAGLAFLVLGDPLHLFGPPAERAGDELSDLGLEGQGRSGDAEQAGQRSGPELASLYGAGDLGGVRLRLKDAATGRARANQDVRLRSRTGSETTVASRSDGEVLFGKVNPGRGWQVLIEGEGFRAVSLVNISVQPGQTTDLGEILLGTNVVLRGRVVDPAGRPVAKATVGAYLPLRGSASQGLVTFLVEQALRVPQPREEVVSDAEGLFAFATLSEGTYSVVARHPGYGTRQHNDVVVKAESAATPLTVRLGEGAKVSGKVTDADGRAIPGARVVALRDQGNRFSLTATLERDEVVTDAKGQYLLDTLVDGSSYRFGVMAEGFASAWDQAPMEVQRAVERSFVLARGGFVEGVVTEEGSGAPVADATVTVVVGRFNPGVMRPGRGTTGATPPSDPSTPGMARTDAQGRFRLGPVLPGPVMSAVVKAPGYTAFSASQWTGNPWPDVSVEQAGSVDVKLRRGGSILGRVRALDGAPVGGATVVAASSGNMGAMFVGSPAATSDAEGAYTIDGVPPGEYHVTVDAPGYAHAEAGSEATKVTMPPEGGAQTLDLALSAAGTIVGKVVDTRGEPVAGAQVRTRADLGRMFRGGGGGAGAGARMVTALNTKADLTDAQGRYRLEGVPTATEWLVEVEAEEFVPVQSERLQLKPGETKELDLTLAGGATLLGRIVGEGGSWVRGARVRVGTLSAEDAQRPYLAGWQIDRQLDPRSFSSDEEGRFAIPNIRPGRVVLKVEHPGYVTYYKRNLALTSDQRLENHQVLLSRGEIVEGVVKGADGKPLAGALVVVTSRSSGRGEEEAAPAGSEESVEPAMNAQTDGDGRFRVENVPPGEWNVAIGFAAGHVGWFGSSDEAAIKRAVRVPARDLEFRLRAQEAGASPFGPGPRPAGTTTPPRPPNVAPAGPGGRQPPPR